MSHPSPPFVSVVTPFYNTAPYLARCIESVLAQTYEWQEYVLLDNCSDDGGSAIAAAYAARDTRIRLHHTEELLPQLANFNRALALVSPRSTYVKMVLADDWIAPECIARMLRVAEDNPHVGMVCSRYREGGALRGVGLPENSTVFPGQLPCERFLIGQGYFFGSPTLPLLRADIVRSRPRFFNEHALHADVEVCFELLDRWDFGFVHEELAELRVEESSISGRLRGFDPYPLNHLVLSEKYADRYLGPGRGRALRRKTWRAYRRHLGRCWIEGRAPEFWAHQRRGLATIGHRLTAMDLAAYAVESATAGLSNRVRRAWGEVLSDPPKGASRSS